MSHPKCIALAKSVAIIEVIVRRYENVRSTPFSPKPHAAPQNRAGSRGCAAFPADIHKDIHRNCG
jgi:hypothetical protein